MAKPFRFNLQKVLDYRAQLEDQAKLALAKAQQLHLEQQRLIKTLEDTLAAHLDDMAHKPTLTAADMWLGRNYAKRLAEDLYVGRQTEERLAQDVILRRQELVVKAKDRKLLEKLKETQAKRHEQEELRKEQAGFDEMATIRFKVQAL